MVRKAAPQSLSIDWAAKLFPLRSGGLTNAHTVAGQAQGKPSHTQHIKNQYAIHLHT